MGPMATADPFTEPFGTLFGDQITVAHGSPTGYTYSGAAQTNHCSSPCYHLFLNDQD